MNNETTEQNVSQDQGTQEVQTASPNGSEMENVQDNTTVSSQGNENDDPEKLKNDFNALKGKMSKLERERNEYQQRLTESETIANTFNDLKDSLQSDPNAWEAVRQARIKKGKDDIGTYESHFGQQSYEGANQPTQNKPPVQTPLAPPSQPQYDPNRIHEDVRTVLEEKEAQDHFFKEVPEMDPNTVKSLDDFEKREKANLYAETYQTAKMLSRTARIPLKDAMVKTWYMRPENEAKYIEKIRKQGEIEGQANAYAQGVGAMSGVSGSNGSQAGKADTRISPEEAQIIKTMGISKEDYLAQRNNG